MGLGHSSWGSGAPEAVWAGLPVPAQMFWASLNSLCSSAHPFAELEGRGVMGEGQRKTHTRTQAKINFWCLQ